MDDQTNITALDHAIREHLSSEGLAAVIAYLRAADMHRPTDQQRSALREVEWLADRLTEMLGVDELTRLMDELAL